MPKRVDSNQVQIVAALRKVGATVQHLHTIGRGCPDILVGFRGTNYLMELKATPVGYKLTDDEKKWHRDWRGNVVIVTSIDEAVNCVTRGTRECAEVV